MFRALAANQASNRCTRQKGWNTPAAMCPPPMILHKHDDPRAERVKSFAAWPDPMVSDAAQLNSRLELDVLLLSERRRFTKDERQTYLSLASRTWTPQALMGSCGWRPVARNTLIVHAVDDETFDIIAFCLNEVQSPELRSALQFVSAAARGMLGYI